MSPPWPKNFPAGTQVAWWDFMIHKRKILSQETPTISVYCQSFHRMLELGQPMAGHWFEVCRRQTVFSKRV